MEREGVEVGEGKDIPHHKTNEKKRDKKKKTSQITQQHKDKRTITENKYKYKDKITPSPKRLHTQH